MAVAHGWSAKHEAMCGLMHQHTNNVYLGNTHYLKHLGGENMRVKITLACTECKQRNYNMTKEKMNHPDRMETSKYCRFCKKHTMHKETK